MRPPHRHPVPFGGQLLDMALQDGIAGTDRGGELDDVADLQALRLDVGGEHSVQHGLVEVWLAPHHREGLARRQHVDRLVAPMDEQLVHGRLVRLGPPREGEIAGLQPLSRLDLEGGVRIDRRVAWLQVQLLVRQQDCERALGLLGGSRRQPDGLDP